MDGKTDDCTDLKRGLKNGSADTGCGGGQGLDDGDVEGEECQTVRFRKLMVSREIVASAQIGSAYMAPKLPMEKPVN